MTRTVSISVSAVRVKLRLLPQHGVAVRFKRVQLGDHVLRAFLGVVEAALHADAGERRAQRRQSGGEQEQQRLHQFEHNPASCCVRQGRDDNKRNEAEARAPANVKWKQRSASWCRKWSSLCIASTLASCQWRCVCTSCCSTDCSSGR